MKPAACFVAATTLFCIAVSVVVYNRANRSPKVVLHPPLRWSAPRTWPSGKELRVADAVSLPEGRTVLLDVSPPPLKSIVPRSFP